MLPRPPKVPGRGQSPSLEGERNGREDCPINELLLAQVARIQATNHGHGHFPEGRVGVNGRVMSNIWDQRMSVERGSKVTPPLQIIPHASRNVNPAAMS